MYNSIKDVDPSTLKFSYRFDYYEDVHNPIDGELLMGIAYFIVAETPDGYRFTRYVCNNHWIIDTNEEGEPYVYLSDSIDDIQARLLSYVDKLNNKESPKLNPPKWQSAEPRYGTQAWSEWHERQIFDKNYMNQ